MKSQGGSSLPTDDYSGILNRLNSIKVKDKQKADEHWQLE